jgi:predicted TPR repeat methyltransferase
MSQDTNEPVYRELANQYDKEVKAYCSYGHEVIFGMSFEFVNAEDKLLDIGIGTGLASIHFFEVGLKVYGLDDSQEMLAACQSKSFTEALIRCDISREPIPYENLYFNHVICCGVLHFVNDLTALFSEVKRVMKSGGVFAFTIAPKEIAVDYVKEPTAWGVSIFKHAPRYIMKLLKRNGMELLKEQRLLIKSADKTNFDMLFSAMIVRCR